MKALFAIALAVALTTAPVAYSQTLIMDGERPARVPDNVAPRRTLQSGALFVPLTWFAYQCGEKRL
jgi:hypothetical protein